MNLQELAEKHCCSKLAPTAYTFQLDQLRAFAEAVVDAVKGDVVGYEMPDGLITNRLSVGKQMGFIPLHHIDMESLG